MLVVRVLVYYYYSGELSTRLFRAIAQKNVFVGSSAALIVRTALADAGVPEVTSGTFQRRIKGRVESSGTTGAYSGISRGFTKSQFPPPGTPAWFNITCSFQTAVLAIGPCADRRGELI
jgi:hypothetical protein